MSIRVLHVIDHLGFGGAPMVVKNIVEKLDSGCVEPIVCALRTNPRAIPIKAKLISLTFGKYNPFALLTIAKLCKEHKIDIVHAHLQKSVVSCLLASLFCDAKVIIHEHGPIFRGGTGCIYRLLLSLLGSKAAAAIANSQATKAALIRTTGLSEKSIFVVGNFVDFTRFDPALFDRDKVRQALSIASDKIVVGFVGRLDVCKGVDLLIEAAAVLCAEDELYHFVIVGEGLQRGQLESMVQRLGLGAKVTFTGLYEKPEEIMTAFDVAVVPSRREAFGISAIELMRMRVPVIASAVGGLVEIIRHEETGILLEELSSASIARAVGRLAGDSSLRQRLTDQASVFSRRFDGREQLKLIGDIYDKVNS
jgi:glycosyltransferase involved in cell wall biosynthesis